MHKTVLFFLLLAACSISVQAQKRSKQLWIGAELGQPDKSLYTGYGISFKGSYGISKNGQLTLTAGFSRFPEANAIQGQSKPHIRLIPILAGYRQNIKNFFVEPQIGIGEIGGETYSVVKADVTRISVAAAVLAINAGYTHKRFSFGVRYQAAQGIEGKSAGFGNDRTIQYAGFFIAYRLFSNNK